MYIFCENIPLEHQGTPNLREEGTSSIAAPLVQDGTWKSGNEDRHEQQGIADSISKDGFKAGRLHWQMSMLR
jgi:hypothetical protein